MADFCCAADNCKFVKAGKCKAPALDCGETKAITGDCATCAKFEAKGDC